MLDQLTTSFYASFQDILKHYRCIVVHGGGPSITDLLGRLNIEGEFHEGLRKTTRETLEVVEMVLGGKVSGQITGELAKHGVKAVGVKGSETTLLRATYMNREKLDYVGKVDYVNADLLEHLLEGDYVPVVSPFGKTDDHQTVNINADVAAAAIAKAVQAEKLLFVTDVPGILVDDQVIQDTTPEEISSLIDGGIIYGGMIPKVQSAVDALSDHMQEVLIVSGEDALVEEDKIKGTSIRAKRKEKIK